MDAVKRVRLSPEERRAQLIDLGVRMLADRPLEQISVEDIADQAGVSRGLLFHYFASSTTSMSPSCATPVPRCWRAPRRTSSSRSSTCCATSWPRTSTTSPRTVTRTCRCCGGPRVVIRRCARCSRAPEPRWRDASSNNCRVSESSPTPASPCRCGMDRVRRGGHDHVAARTRNPPDELIETCHRLARGGPQRRRRGGPSRRLTLPRVLRTYRGGRVLDLAFCALIAGDGCWISRFAHLSRGRPIRGRERHRPATRKWTGRCRVRWSADQRDHFVGENAVSMISCCSTA